MTFEQTVNQLTCYIALVDIENPISDNSDALDVMTNFFVNSDSGWSASNFFREASNRNINMLDMFEDMINADQNSFEQVCL
jgi:hypothetical protein